MSDAFRCDECLCYFDGNPAEKLYTKEVTHYGITPVLRAELCGPCSKAFAGGPSDDETDARPRAAQDGSEGEGS
jgi:hypothetical protein